MILLIDNYDSFTYNIYQYLGSLDYKIKVLRNDQLTVAAIGQLKPEAIVLSPGPGTPDEAGITLACIREYAGKIPILGVCLGHQAIAQAFGALVVRAKKPMHGKTSVIEHRGKGLFKGLPKTFEVTRYHSLLVDPKSLPASLEATAWTQDGVIMALKHKRFLLEGVQFHPESYQTQHGMQMFRNFMMAAQQRGIKL
ncbi:MAG: aminodeoxychorismate/anthranilate synthase component II [Proteobacteria bacterium]|nr:aminodeoxychorismate/anthranilate synthase component II [Pseudomonadota bacterium]